MKYSFAPKGVCSRRIDFEIEDGIVKDVSFLGGCDGNAKGLSKLCIGRSVDEIASVLNGVTCGRRNTSCPDQLAKALKQSLEN